MAKDLAVEVAQYEKGLHEVYNTLVKRGGLLTPALRLKAKDVTIKFLHDVFVKQEEEEKKEEEQQGDESSVRVSESPQKNEEVSEALKKEHNDAVDKSILLLQKMSALLRVSIPAVSNEIDGLKSKQEKVDSFDMDAAAKAAAKASYQNQIIHCQDQIIQFKIKYSELRHEETKLMDKLASDEVIGDDTSFKQVPQLIDVECYTLEGSEIHLSDDQKSFNFKPLEEECEQYYVDTWQKFYDSEQGVQEPPAKKRRGTGKSFQIGDNVMVKWQGKWHPATIQTYYNQKEAKRKRRKQGYVVDWILEDAAYTDGVQPKHMRKPDQNELRFFEDEDAAEDEEEEEDDKKLST